jgi:hypothetical protein
VHIARVAVTAGLLVAAAGAVGAVRAATRLDRLHMRTDAAWAALDAALRRRARAVRVLNGSITLRCAADAALGAGGHLALRVDADLALRAGADSALRAGADSALRAGEGNPIREEIENELGQLLAVLDRRGIEQAYAGRLADAEQRVVIARRVYNDAVRDTLALRSHRMVRWLRLAGTAAAPRYFDIAEPALPSDFVVSE